MAAQRQNENFYELYRVSSIGTTLADTIDEMITLNKLEPQIAMRLLATFDRVIADVLSTQVKSRMSFKGNLDTYRFCDEVWTFVLKDVKFKMDNQSQLEAGRIKIVSMNSKLHKARYGEGEDEDVEEDSQPRRKRRKTAHNQNGDHRNGGHQNGGQRNGNHQHAPQAEWLAPTPDQDQSWYSPWAAWSQQMR